MPAMACREKFEKGKYESGRRAPEWRCRLCGTCTFLHAKQCRRCGRGRRAGEDFFVTEDGDIQPLRLLANGDVDVPPSTSSSARRRGRERSGSRSSAWSQGPPQSSRDLTPRRDARRPEPGSAAARTSEAQRAEEQLRQARAAGMPADVIALLEEKKSEAVQRRESERSAKRSAGQRLDAARARLGKACDKYDCLVDCTTKYMIEAQERQDEALLAVRMASDEYNEAVAVAAKDSESKDPNSENLAAVVRPLIDAVRRTSWADAPADFAEIVERVINAVESTSPGAPGEEEDTEVGMQANDEEQPEAKRHCVASARTEEDGGGAAAPEASTSSALPTAPSPPSSMSPTATQPQSLPRAAGSAAQRAAAILRNVVGSLPGAVPQGAAGDAKGVHC